jgi:hypothetical protein
MRGNTQKLHKPSLPPGALEELKAAFQTFDLDGGEPLMTSDGL